VAVDINWIEVFGYAGALLTLGTFAMTKMIPLRIVGIGANFAFISYGALAPIYPVLVLHMILLPLNSLRLYQMLQLIQKVREASQGDLNFDWLKPFMSKRACKAGETIFRKGDLSSAMFYTVSGRFRLDELTIDEIAQSLSLSREAVKGRLHRARGLIREYLTG
jgi:CRP/FNR family transcriptional regulator, cyclic AMP receptor protein